MLSKKKKKMSYPNMPLNLKNISFQGQFFKLWSSIAFMNLIVMELKSTWLLPRWGNLQTLRRVA
jgi:hypothetical protein